MPLVLPRQMQLLGPGEVVVTGSPVAAEISAVVSRLQVSAAAWASGVAARTRAARESRRAERRVWIESMRGLLSEG